MFKYGEIKTCRKVGRMNLVDEIRRDHQSLTDLLNDLCTAENGENKSRNYGSTIQMVMAHEQAEEETLYDALERFPGIKDETLNALRVHEAIKHMIVHLRLDTTPDDVQWKPRICQLREVAIHHMINEEEKILPYAHNNLSPTDLDLLGRQYVSSMKELQELESLPRE